MKIQLLFDYRFMIIFEKKLRYYDFKIKWNVFIKVDFIFKITNYEIKLIWKNIFNNILLFNYNDNLKILVFNHF